MARFPLSHAISSEQLEVLRAYAAGRLGTRAAIEALGAHDYADLVIALAQNDLEFPKPTATPMHDAHLARAGHPATSAAPCRLRSPLS